MTPLEGAVRLMENWSVTGKLSDLNVGQCLDLTETLLNLFTAQKPKKTPKAPQKSVETPKPVHVNMSEETPWD